ncbi:hypothetical protein [Streptomyces sp. NPDC054783]
MAMFGVLTFLNQYLRTARGESPTAAGLVPLPMALGLLIASTGSGRLITRTGRWKVFLVAGTASLAMGLALLGTGRYDTAYWHLSIFTDDEHLERTLRRGLRHIQLLPDLIDGCLTGTGLTLTHRSTTTRRAQ